MNWSPARWALACVLACTLLAVTFLPVGYDEDAATDYWWQPAIKIRADKIHRRYNIMWDHTRRLNRNFKAAQETEIANRVFGANHETAAKPLVWYAPDIPLPVRARIGGMITRERAGRVEWAGHGAVGVLVLSDTATKIGGFPLPAFFDRDRALTTVVLPATPANGNHCVTVVRLRHQVFSRDTAAWGTALLPLDGCAFTDAFGAPGPKIAEFLRTSRYSYSRRLSYSPKDTTIIRARDWYEAGDNKSKRCRAGIDSSCVLSAVAGQWPDGWYDRQPDLSVPAPDESSESYGTSGDFEETFMEAVARDLGPARFQRMWQSQKPLADAYFDEMGEPLAAWIRARETMYRGPYRIGAMQAPASAFLTILSVLVLAAISIRFAPRPYKI